MAPWLGVRLGCISAFLVSRRPHTWPKYNTMPYIKRTQSCLSMTSVLYLVQCYQCTKREPGLLCWSKKTVFFGCLWIIYLPLIIIYTIYAQRHSFLARQEKLYYYFEHTYLFVILASSAAPLMDFFLFYFGLT